VAKLRSPILGYNHNVRYRGLVFHVQTEDSGITNPHVFTHLFHGGVILSTRKLVYDAGASEEAVKSLMQAQHKATLKDLKRGNFDDKIDAYLGGTPGLLPRGQGVDVEPPVAVPPGEAAPLAPAEEAVPVTVTFDPTGSSPVVIDSEHTTRDATPPMGARHPPPMPTAASIAIPPPGRTSSRMPATDTVEARAPTVQIGSGGRPPMIGGQSAQSMTPPPVTTRDASRRGVSDAFQAIMVEGESAGGGGVVEVAEDEAIEIHSGAPGSAPPLPGERPGSYAQHKRRESGRMYAVTEPPPPGPAAAPTPPAKPGRHTPVPQRPAGPLSRPPTPMATARPPTTPPAIARPAAPLPTYPSGRPASPAPTTGRGAAASRTRSPTGGGGVVVTRPAVIIGAPSRTIGNPAQPPQQQPPASSANPTPAKGTPSRVRKAREDSDSGIFGQDLISEKSLDEVILAYLSEDSNDDD